MTNINATTPQLQVIRRLANAITSHDVKSAEPLLSKDFTFRTLPKAADLPDLTKEEFLQKKSAMWDLFAKIEVTSHEEIESPGKAVVQLSFLFTTADGAVALEWDAVVIFTFVNEDGEPKIVDCMDFADSEKRSAHCVGVAKLMAQQGIAAA